MRQRTFAAGASPGPMLASLQFSHVPSWIWGGGRRGEEGKGGEIREGREGEGREGRKSGRGGREGRTP